MTSYILVAVRAPTRAKLKYRTARLRKQIHQYALTRDISISDNTIPPDDYAAATAAELLADIMSRRTTGWGDF